MSNNNVMADAPISMPASSSTALSNPARSAELLFTAVSQWSESPALHIEQTSPRALDHNFT
eukprot:8472009-Pyramimonas_sp.AAC.1